MLEKPALPEEKIIACLQDNYGLLVGQVTFLPLGVDSSTAVYRAVAADGTAYFVKLRRGSFDELSVALPKYLSDQGIAQIIAPLASRSGQLWATLDPFTMMLYPFVQGRDGYGVALSQQQWRAFGVALKHLHTTNVPAAFSQHLLQERYTPQWRTIVKHFQERAETETFTEPVAVQVAALLRDKRTEIDDLVARAERLAQRLQASPPEFVVCHTDLHAGNLLICDKNTFYIVDWDNPILAPKERDLMFIGGGQGFIGYNAAEEEDLFYQGYGPTTINASALAYYRYERIVQDIADFCRQIFLTDEGGADRTQALRYLAANFLPGGVLEVAYQSDKTLDVD
jgi:spectinomycin phosphotransferase